MEQQVLRFGWVVCGAAGLCRVLRCWSAVVAKLPCNCAMEIKRKNKYFHPLIMLALLQIRSLSVIVTGPDHNAHTIYTHSGCPELRQNRAGFHFYQSGESFEIWKAKQSQLHPLPLRVQPKELRTAEGSWGITLIICSAPSGVLTQHRPCLVLSSSGWILLPCGDTGAGGKKREGEGEKPCRFHQSDRQQIEEGAEVV